jgi:hypothetical protein
MPWGSGNHGQDKRGEFQDGLLRRMSPEEKGQLGLLVGMPQLAGKSKE